ncbi:efflux RND transporter periplasmic adaptor subunit [Rubinisphaera italica]|uniref:Cobalt-zinc-cadmium resistance protein CzcB n=1 Tax=Rubinisphaera italica TaxID=2527969 RepID=A0A5C5XN96_9PLAN|nr:efflux RND transporter periplasmic adaptor subunit [Rubinisphaera italica]TWT64364.1 Cobalt-zinc-cadmium resistance protein CzcB [Rubinisphaera italica]
MSEVLTSPKIPAESLPSKPSVKSQTVPKENHAQTGKRPQQSRLWRVAASVMSWIPSVVVVAGLGGLAWYGHHNDWKLPSLAATASPEANAPAWCDSHGVPEEECINCVPGLIEDPPKLTFCDVHGIHGCVLHDPSLAETKSPVEVVASDLERAERALAVRPRRENLSLSQLPGSRIQFASVDAMQSAGVDVEPVQRQPVVESVATAGEIRYDATKTAQVSPPADGIVKQVLVNVGDWVQAGQVLAIVDSEKVGRLKSELLSALSDERLKQDTVRRIEPLANRNVIPGKRLLESQTELQQATSLVEKTVRSLDNLGLSVDLEQLRSMQSNEARAAVRKLGTEKIEERGGSDNLIAVVAPLTGRVVDRETVVGEVVDRGSQMFRLSDTRTVWLDLRVPAEEASLAEIGQEVRYLPDGQTAEHRGKVIWISSDVDRETRTVRVRAELANSDGELRNESFGTGEIILRDESDAIVVPESSVQWDGENTLVFVRDARFFEKDRPKFFVARSVRVGVTQDGFTEIIAGVLPGEVVASSGSDVLRAQLLKNNLGAGCTCGH